MKAIWWVLIVTTAFFLPLLIVFVVTILILGLTWWWTLGVFIVEFVLGLVVAAIFIAFSRLKKKKPEPKVSVDSIVQRAIIEKKMDPDNPDNFLVQEKILCRYGDTNYEKTAILWIHGVGTELNKRIDCITPLTKAKEEKTWLENASDEKCIQIARLMAEHPEQEINEERTTGLDEYGRPTTTVRTKRMSSSEKKLEQEKKEAEEANSL